MILIDPADPPSALPRGTRLGEFEIKRVLGAGGFGIVYLALDHALEREVAIKEYMPVSMAGRTAALHVSLLSQSDAESFALGLRSFVNEARLLARFDHPSLVKVHRYWEHNNTAYMAMPFYAGHSLQRTRRHLVGPPPEAYVRSILEPLLGALERLHREGVYHRDIAPDNIIVAPDGRPVLLDFGAARRVLADMSVALTAILKPAYAPIEQYGETGAVKQGPWTDLYALGATMRYLLLGHPPAPATTRTVVDELPPIAGQPLAGCSAGFLHCIDWMMQPRPADRPQSVAALRDALDACRAAMPGGQPAPAGTAENWQATQAMRSALGQAHAATVLDPSLVPATVRAAPALPSEPTQVMQHDAPGAEPTVLMAPPAGPTQRLDGPTASVPLPAAATPTPALPKPAPAGARHAGRTDPTLDQPPADASEAGPASAARPAAAAPVRPAAKRWPLAAGGAGAAALLGLALWFTGSRGPLPAGSPQAAAPAASASLAAASALATAAASDAVPAPVAARASAAAISAAPAALATAAAAAAPPASPVLADAGPAAKAARPAANVAPVKPLAQAAAASRATAPAAGRNPAPPPVLAAAPAPAAPASADPGGRPGLATSITRLPAADAPAAAGPSAPPAAAPVLATNPSPAPAAAATLPPANAIGSQTPARQAPMAAAPATTTGAAAGLPAQPSPATAGRAAAAPARAADRDNEPVLVRARALGPSERCEGRVLVALWACIERQCKTDASLRDHPECQKLRREQ